jgi:hypothetical protein
VKRSVVVAMLLLVGLAIGLCLEPDSGTAASFGAPEMTQANIGPNHAKPLPRIPLVSDVVRLVPVLLIAILALHRPIWAEFTLAERHDVPRLQPLRSTSAARRGPPAPV